MEGLERVSVWLIGARAQMRAWVMFRFEARASNIE